MEGMLRGFKANCLHGGRKQSSRIATYENMINGESDLRVMVATDVGSPRASSRGVRPLPWAICRSCRSCGPVYFAVRLWRCDPPPWTGRREADVRVG